VELLRLFFDCCLIPRCQFDVSFNRYYGDMFFDKTNQQFNALLQTIDLSNEQIRYTAGAFRDVATGIIIAALIPLFVDKKFDIFTLGSGIVSSALLWYIGGKLLKGKS